MSNGLAQFTEVREEPEVAVTSHASLSLQRRLSELIEIYEFMRKWRKEKSMLRKFIAGQAMRDGIATVRNQEGFLVATAFFWQVSDPYDAARIKDWPPHEPEGKYLFFPVCYIRKDSRPGVALVRKLLKISFNRNPHAKRAAWVRDENPKLVHVMKMRP